MACVCAAFEGWSYPVPISPSVNITYTVGFVRDATLREHEAGIVSESVDGESLAMCKAPVPAETSASPDKPGAEGERLKKSVVREIVRLNYGAFRTCYEHGLAVQNDLTGEVNVRFIIERDGTVVRAWLGDITLPNCSVVECIRRGFLTIEFPKPNGGTVSVLYPIVLKPG